MRKNWPLMKEYIGKQYSKQGLLTLFLICAFLPHLWTIILAFKDFSLLIDRTGGIWNTAGVMSYGLLFAFIESFLVFILTVLLGFLISSKWEEPPRITALGFLVAVPMLWEIYRQTVFLLQWHMPSRIIRFMALFPNPTGLLYAFTFIIVALITIIPLFLILRRGKFYQSIHNVMERITLLSMFYLFFDAVALILVIVRNV
jgi:hypothetical protein